MADVECRCVGERCRVLHADDADERQGSREAKTNFTSLSCSRHVFEVINKEHLASPSTETGIGNVSKLYHTAVWIQDEATGGAQCIHRTLDRDDESTSI